MNVTATAAASTDTTTAPTSGPAVTANGTNGQITIEGDRVLIRKGLLSRRSGIRGERLVPLARIAAVRLETATDTDNGYLRLVMQGEDPASQEPANGEYTIRFTPASTARFEQVRARLEALL